MMSIGVLWFTADTWRDLLTVAADRENLPNTFAEFEAIAGAKFDRLRAQGVPVEKVLVSVQDLAAWCRGQGHPINGLTRAAFAGFVLARRAAAH